MKIQQIYLVFMLNKFISDIENINNSTTMTFVPVDALSKTITRFNKLCSETILRTPGGKQLYTELQRRDYVWLDKPKHYVLVHDKCNRLIDMSVRLSEICKLRLMKQY